MIRGLVYYWSYFMSILVYMEPLLKGVLTGASTALAFYYFIGRDLIKRQEKNIRCIHSNMLEICDLKKTNRELKYETIELSRSNKCLKNEIGKISKAVNKNTPKKGKK